MSTGKVVLVLASNVGVGMAASQFVPACIARQCGNQLVGLAKDGYTSELLSCASDTLGPCAGKIWECLGDETCRGAATCAPKVFNTCKADLWKMITDDKEREMLMCISNCTDSSGKPSASCVAEKCGAAAVHCLIDETCRHVVNCVPETLLSCSKSAFSCVFSSSGICRDNVRCLGSGLAQCSSPGINILTDTKVADLVECAGSKCPHPQGNSDAVGTLATDNSTKLQSAPIDAIKEMLCMTEKCPLALPKILVDQDSKDLLTCVTKVDFSPIWDCLGDDQCKTSLRCWVQPVETCASELWSVLTDDVERQRIEAAVSCLQTCGLQHKGDFVDAGFCALDTCSEGLLECWNDATCKNAAKCFPNAMAQCTMPTLENYMQQQLLQKATKSIATGLKVCGRAAVEMFRDQKIAEAVRCASQCTRFPGSSASSSIVV